MLLISRRIFDLKGIFFLIFVTRIQGLNALIFFFFCFDQNVYLSLCLTVKVWALSSFSLNLLFVHEHGGFIWVLTKLILGASHLFQVFIVKSLNFEEHFERCVKKCLLLLRTADKLFINGFLVLNKEVTPSTRVLELIAMRFVEV